MSRSEREGEGEDEGWFCRLQVGQRTEQSFGARRGRTEVLQCQQGTLISSCRVRFSRGGYCAQVCLGTKAGFPDGMLSACRLQSNGARLRFYTTDR